ncbi:MAG: OadG family protein [Clostridiales bacterium]|nr:OadG family protein [Clostridiales bacterium]
MEQGLKVMAYGLGGVFVVLIIFYIITRILLAIAKKADPDKPDA